MTPPPAQIFISRAGAEAALAVTIADILTRAGYTVILEDRDFASTGVVNAIHDGLRTSARVIALLSPDYLASDYCRAEWQSVIARDPLNRRRRLIVMRAVECAAEGLLTQMQYWEIFPLRDNLPLLRDVVLAAVEDRHEAQTLPGKYWREPEAVLHPAIRPVPNFTGRREDLAALADALWSTGTAAITQAAAVHGSGGIGKSVLAQQYAWENRARYAGVWRLEAETPPGIRSGLVQLGARFIRGLDEVADQGAAAQAALDFLSGGGFAKPWLLIYDNADTPQTLANLTPPAGAQVLITSRFPAWQGRATPVHLGVFPLEDAVQYLLAFTARSDDPGAARLAETLGCLPLALAHAAAFCAETGDSFDDYAARVADWITRAPAGADYPQTVFATFSLALDKAASACPEAERLMGIFACMAPADIPRDIVTAEVMDAMTLRDATGALSRAALLTVTPRETGGPLVSMHRLAQLVMRGRLAARGQAQEAKAAALRLVAEGFPFESGDVRFWPACEQLYPHALAVLEIALENGELAEKTALLLGMVAHFLQSRASYAAAEPLMRRALAIDEHNFGPDHPSVARDLSNLAALYLATNRQAEAEPLMRRAIRIYESASGANHPHVAAALNNLVTLLLATNRQAEAEPLMRRALGIAEIRFGADHPKVASCLGNLAVLLEEGCGNYEESELLKRRALRIDEISFGPDHPKVAIRLNNLAQLLKATNRLAEAEPLMRRAFAIWQNCFGADHPNVASALNNLAQLLQDTNRLTEAEPLMRRALIIDERSLGADHPHVATDLNNLAQLLQATNRLTEAEPLMRRAVEIFFTSLGPDPPSTRGVFGNYEHLLACMQDGSREEAATPMPPPSRWAALLARLFGRR